MTYGGPPATGEGEGCLVVAIRMPIRVLALIVVLPLRLAWDALCAVGRGLRVALRALWRYVLAPPLIALGRLAVALWRRVLAPLGRLLIVIPLVWLCRSVLVPVIDGFVAAVVFLARYGLVGPAAALWRYVLAPIGRGLAWLLPLVVFLPLAFLWQRIVVPVGKATGIVLVLLVRFALVWPAVALWRHVVLPLGRGLRWLLLVLVVTPLVFVWRRIVVPVAREVGTALWHAWRVAAYVSRAVGRGLSWLFRVLVAVPVAFVWRRTAVPFFRAAAAAGRWAGRATATAGRWTRINVLRPAAQAAGEARRAVRVALFGGAGGGRKPPSPR